MHCFRVFSLYVSDLWNSSFSTHCVFHSLYCAAGYFSKTHGGVVVVVVFFYLLILKGPVFLPGLVFPPEIVWMLFALDSLFLLGCCWRPPWRGQAGGLGANSASGILGSSKGPGPWATLAAILILAWFVSFLGKAVVPHARPNGSNLLPGTQIVLSLCPTSHTQLGSRWRA